MSELPTESVLPAEPEVPTDAESDESPFKNWRHRNDPDDMRREDFNRKDWALNAFLDMTVDLPGSIENSLSLSVTVDGMLISGKLIHRMKWAELFVAEIKAQAGVSPELADGIEHVITSPLIKTAAMLERRAATDLPNPARAFVHFQDARLYTPGTHSDYSLWRVAIDDISGWSLGAHTPAT